MQETDYSGIAERAVLVGLLTDDTVATRIASQWTASGLFASAYANTLAGWAVAYAQRYGQAPRDRIMLQFASWSRKVKDSSTVQMVRELLESLDGEWSGANSNSQYILDQAQNLFESVALRSVAEQMEAALDVGDVAAARRISTNTVIPQLSGSTWFNPLTDELGMKGAFAAKSAPLIQMPGDMGDFLGTTLERDAFVAFRGIAKVGKSFTLMSLAYEAVRQKNKTLFIAIGDMSADQVRLRWASRVSRRPRVASTVLVPVSWDDDAEPASPRPVFNEVVHTESLSPEIVMAKSQRFMHRYQIPDDTFRVSIHPSRSLSVLGLHDMLQRGASEGWIPDCIAEGSLVLTDKGLVPIQNVTLSHKLWDGLNWVTHQGAVCKGTRRVITYAGLTATPDHMVYTDHGWRTLEQCSQLGLRVAETGYGGTAVRLGDRYASDGATTLTSREDREVGVRRLRPCAVCSVSAREVDSSGKYTKWQSEGLPRVHAAQAVPELVLCQGASRSSSVYESQAQGVGSVRWTGDSVLLSIRDGRLPVVGQKCTQLLGSELGTGPDRKRRELRAWEYQDVDAEAEHSTHVKTATDSMDACIPDEVPRGPVCGQHTPSTPQADVRSSDQGSVGGMGSEGQTRVWDIVNAGPLHRFTVQGRLAHNCIIIDYVDLMGPVPGIQEKRDQIDETWARLRGLSQEYHNLIITASQSDTQGYTKEVLGMENFNGSRTQNDHPTAIISLNQNQEEATFGLVRWHMTANRDNNERRQLMVAGCRGIGNPMILSKFCE